MYCKITISKKKKQTQLRTFFVKVLIYKYVVNTHNFDEYSFFDIKHIYALYNICLFFSIFVYSNKVTKSK